MHDAPYKTAATDVEDGRVLLVEDVPAMRFYLRVALEREGIEVTEAGSLHDARLALRHAPAIRRVLLDLQLPDGDGLELLPELRPDVRVVALTAHDSAEIALRCTAAGCSAWVYKGDLAGCIADVLEALQYSGEQASTRAVPDADLCERYLGFLTEASRELRRAYLHCDLSAMHRLVHRLRGTAVHFGYAEIGTSARAFGTALDCGDPEQRATAFDQLSEYLQQALSAKRCPPGAAARGSRTSNVQQKTPNPEENQ